jgi:hypothetical protein
MGAKREILLPEEFLLIETPKQQYFFILANG